MAERYEDQYRRDRGYRRDERGFIDRAGDEVRSWFGDDDAERRRQLDDRERGYSRDREGYSGYGDRSSGSHSGYRYGERPQGYGDRSQSYADRSFGYGGDRSYGAGGYGGGSGYGAERPSADRGYDRNAYGSDRSSSAMFEPRSSYGSGSSTFDRDDRSQGSGWFTGRGPKGYQRSDTRINEDVCDRLCDSAEIDASDIEVRVDNGEVTLTGSVSDRSQKRRAEDLIEQVSGVREVHNNLRVGSADLAAGSRSGTAAGAGMTGSAAAASANRGNTSDAATPEQPGNVLGVTGGVDKTAAAGRR